MASRVLRRAFNNTIKITREFMKVTNNAYHEGRMQVISVLCPFEGVLSGRNTRSSSGKRQLHPVTTSQKAWLKETSKAICMVMEHSPSPNRSLNDFNVNVSKATLCLRHSDSVPGPQNISHSCIHSTDRRTQAGHLREAQPTAAVTNFFPV